MSKPFVFIARRHVEEPVPGIVKVTMELFRDEDHLEIDEGDEFYTVTMTVDPFK